MRTGTADRHWPNRTNSRQEVNMPIRVGVIGAGVMGADHIKNLSAAVNGAEVTFVADLDAARAAAAAPSAARTTTDPSELINSSEVDAVVIASHDSTHAGLVLECFEAMTPVLCEKPLAPTLLESLDVVEAEADILAATGARLLSMGFMRRFDPGYAALHESIRVRSYGERLLGTPVTEVSWQAGRSSRHSTGDLQDPALMLLRTADGALATLELFLNAQSGYTTRCEVVSEYGSAALPEPAALVVHHEGQQRLSIPADWRPRFADAYRLQLQAWISALERGESAPLATGEDGLRASQVAQAMIRSLHSDGSFTKVIY
jgi:myo-inositol 2-dehydrogenase / D-chiro-inositol 1-dehydrogenase